MKYIWFGLKRSVPLQHDQGLALLTLSQDKNSDSHSPMNGYPSFLTQDSVSSAKPRVSNTASQYN